MCIHHINKVSAKNRKKNILIKSPNNLHLLKTLKEKVKWYFIIIICVWRSEDNSVQWILFIHLYVESRDQIKRKFPGLWDKHL